VLQHGSAAQQKAINVQLAAIAASPISQSYATMEALMERGFAMRAGATVDEYFGKLWMIMQAFPSKYRDIWTSSQQPWLESRNFPQAEVFRYLHGDPSVRSATARQAVEEVARRAALGLFTTILIVGAALGEDAIQLAALLSALGFGSEHYRIIQRDVCRHPTASSEVEVVTGNGMGGVENGKINVLLVSWADFLERPVFTGRALPCVAHVLRFPNKLLKKLLMLLLRRNFFMKQVR
jgi:hypothetical protein